MVWFIVNRIFIVFYFIYIWFVFIFFILIFYMILGYEKLNVYSWMCWYLNFDCEGINIENICYLWFFFIFISIDNGGLE